MIKSLSLIAFGALSLAAAPVQQPAPMAPRGAIVAAADAAPRGVPGIFAMRVAATGRVGPRIYLNSERDYRDQRNLSIEISPWAAQQLAHRFGGAPETRLRGRDIEVRGQARRVRIGFFDNFHRPTGLYYYQTHVVVTDADQIRILD